MALSVMSNYAGGFRMKVVKAYSIDMETFKLLERYPRGKKSEVVNEAIKWYLGNEHVGEALEAQEVVIGALRDEINRLRRPGLFRRILLRMRE
jgi:hypothetical protein